MRGAALVVLGLTGLTCSAPPARVAAPPPAPEPEIPPPPIVEHARYALPTAPPPPAFTRQCETFGKAAPRVKTRQYDFAPVALPTTQRVPTAAERPKHGRERTVPTIRGVVARRSGEIAACWTWAQVKHDLRSLRVDVAFHVDPWGRVSDVDATSRQADTAELLACIEDAVATSRAGGITTRGTRGEVAIHLWQVEQPPPVRKPRKPKPFTPLTLRGTLCAPIETAAPDDVVRVPAPLHITDFDEARQPAAGHSTAVRVGCASASSDIVDKLSIRREMRGNMGGFSACHADARTRLPELAGEVVLTWQLPRGGYADHVVVTGAGDAALHACLRAALEDVWFDPSADAPITVTYTFTLDAPAAAAADDGTSAQARLDAGDVEGALALWATWLDTRPDDADACAWRAGVLNAMTVRAPWLDDDRVRGALADLVAHVTRLDRDAGARCLAAAEPALELVRGTIRKAAVGRDFVDAWREPMALLELLAPVFDRLADGDELTQARVLGIAQRSPELAIAELDVLGADDTALGEWARDHAARLRRAPDMWRSECFAEDDP